MSLQHQPRSSYLALSLHSYKKLRMAEFTAVPFPNIGLQRSDRLADPWILRRVSICGHLDELIGLQQLGSRKQWHCLITFESSKDYSRAENCPVYIKARCLVCAIEAKEKDDANQIVQPKRTLGLYQAGTLSTYAEWAGTTSRGGFDDVLERHRCSRNQCTITKPHPHALSGRNEDPRSMAQQKAASYPDEWPLTPATQFWNVPYDTTGRVKPDIYRRITSSLSGSEEGPLQDVMRKSRIYGERSSPCLQLGKKENKDTGHVIRESAEIYSVNSVRRPTVARTSNSGEKGFRLVVTSSYSTSNSKLAEQGHSFDEADPTGKNSDSFLFDRTVDTERYQTADTSASFAKESALIENLIEEYASLVDAAFDPNDPDLVDTRYERPRPVPAVPKGETLDPSKHLSSFTTRGSTKPKPVSRNFRRLRLETHYSARSVHKTQSDQESPDWACRTSLAIEAGKIAMDSVHMHRGGSTPAHIMEAMCSPMKIYSSDLRRVQISRPGEKEATYPSLSDTHSLTHPAAGRHSEGALQLVRGIYVARLVGEFKGMEVAMEEGEELLKPDSVQVASPMDLNKNLPALPL